MKFRQGYQIYDNHPLLKLWEEAALNMTMEYGILIEVIKEWVKIEGLQQRLYFRVEDHQFECLRDLRKALKNKAFL